MTRIKVDDKIVSIIALWPKLKNTEGIVLKFLFLAIKII